MLTERQRLKLEALQDVIRYSVLAQATRNDDQFDRYVISLAHATSCCLTAMFPEHRFSIHDASRFVESAFVESYKTIKEAILDDAGPGE